MTYHIYIYVYIYMFYKNQISKYTFNIKLCILHAEPYDENQLSVVSRFGSPSTQSSIVVIIPNGHSSSEGSPKLPTVDGRNPANQLRLVVYPNL